jgi:hypothetical protein
MAGVAMYPFDDPIWLIVALVVAVVLFFAFAREP